MLLTITISVLIPFCSVMLAQTLDGWMSYNAIFAKFRIKKAASYYGKKFDKLYKDNVQGNFDESNDGFNAVMWEVANKYSDFVLWLCVDCMSTRLFFILYGLTIASLHFVYQIAPSFELYTISLVLGLSLRKLFLNVL